METSPLRTHDHRASKPSRAYAEITGRLDAIAAKVRVLEWAYQRRHKEFPSRRHRPSAGLPTLPQRNPRFLDLVRSQACLLSRLSSQHRCDGPVEAHHEFRYLLGVSEGGTGKKGSDYLAIPLCHGGHMRRHSVGKELLDDATCLRESVRLLILFFGRKKDGRSLRPDQPRSE